MINNKNLYSELIVDIPFTYNDTADIIYNKRYKDTKIKNISRDSLIKQNDFIDTITKDRLQMFITLSNSLPFTVTGTFQFIDTTKTTNDSILSMHIIKDPTLDTFTCPPPQIEYIPPTSKIVTPSTKELVFDLDSAAFSHLAQVTTLRVIVNANNEELHPNLYTKFQIDTTNNFKVQIGIATNLQAVFDFNKKEKQNPKHQ